MMKRGLKTPLMVIAVLLIGTVFSSSGCRKKKDTIAIIHVRDTAGSPVSGALVRLDGNSSLPPGQGGNENLHLSATSDGAGSATFNFNEVYQLGQAGVAVVDVTAEKDGMEGSGIIKVEQEKTSEETVFI
jgi:hypothetical protein